MKKARKKRSPRRTTRTSTRPKSSAAPERRSPSKKRKSTSRRPRRAAYLGLGSNLGDRRANLRAALARIGMRAKVRRVSSLYRTEPVGHADQPVFYNAVARIGWSGTPRALLLLVQRIERGLGRAPTFRNGPRVIDVDVLDLDGTIRSAPDPVLPHPRLRQRRFMLAPLAEIAPGWRHPETGRTARRMLAALPARPWARNIGKI